VSYGQSKVERINPPTVNERTVGRSGGLFVLALQLPFLKISESMGNHDSKIVGADRVD